MSGLEALIIGGIGTAASAGGTIMSSNAEASAIEGNRFNQLLSGIYRAQAMKYAADESRAAGQRKSMALDRDKNLALSRGRAVAASGGGGADDTSVVNTMAGVEAQGEFQKAMEMYGAESRAIGFEDEGRAALIGAFNKDAAAKYQAQSIRNRGNLEAAGTILSGAGSAFDRYNLSKRGRGYYG